MTLAPFPIHRLFYKVFIFLLIVGHASFAQTNQELALSKAKEAIKLEDEQGKYDEAIKLLNEASELDPKNITYPYEIAYTYTIKKEYKKAADILEKLINEKDGFPRIYQALGNNYDYLGLPEKAIETYEKGLKKFPNSGELYLELGNMNGQKKDYPKALSFYEKGIQAAPSFPSNYYRASIIFCNSSEPVWGMLYGELFINIERNTKRTQEISKLLYNTYKKQITFPAENSVSVSFSKNHTMTLADLKDPANVKLPFAIGCYEMLMMASLTGEKAIDLSSLSRVRENFIKGYLRGDMAKKYPNVLFDYQQKVLNTGHFEAYNYWLLLGGEPDGVNKWISENKEKWDNFMKWFPGNGVKLDSSNKFYRAQY